MREKRQPTSKLCFLCGKDNPHGLKLVWFNDYDNKLVYTNVTVPETYRSYPGVVHGGIIAALIDETSGRAAWINDDFNSLMVTLKMEVIYKKVTPTNTPIKVVGRLIKGTPKRAVVVAEVILPDGSISAKGSVIIYRMPPEVKTDWGAEEQAEWERTQNL